MSKSLLPVLADLPMTEVVQAARQEHMQYRHRQATADCYRYELFRRAIVQDDEWAWSALYEFYAPLVSVWILARASRAGGSDLDSLVNETFARFARAVTARQWRDFASVGALLSYLKRCAHSAVLDHGRWGQPQRREESLEGLSTGGEPLLADCAEDVCERMAAQELWDLLCRVTPAPAERLVLWLVCVQGLPPRAVHQLHPTVFPQVADVYRIKRTVLERLQRHQEVRQCGMGQAREVRS